MASNSESPTRSRSKYKQKRNDNMEVETNTKEDALERSIEEIRSKMIQKRRKKGQADLSCSRSRYKNANLVLKASLRQNNRNLAKSLEVARNESRHAQNELVELQRERHLLQSVVNRFQDQHVKQRNQIKGVHEVLRKVTSSLMDTVGLLGQAMDMCVIPRPTKDRSLGLVFRTSSLTSDDLSDSETKGGGGSASAGTSNENLSGIPRRIPANKENQSPCGNNPMEEMENLPDIDIPLLFMSDKSVPQGKERTRRDTRNISAGNQKLSRRTSSLLDPATIAAVATEIEKSAESIQMVLEETDDAGEGTDDRQAPICIDEEESAQEDEMDGVRSAEEGHGRRVSKKRSGRPSVRKEVEDSEDGHSEDKKMEDVLSMSKDDGMQMDDGHKGKVGKRKSGRLSKKKKTYVCPDDDVDEIKEKDHCIELVPEDEEIVESSSEIRSSRKRSGRLSRRRGTFDEEDSDMKTLGMDDHLQQIEIFDDDDFDLATVRSKVGDLNQQEDDTKGAVAELQQRHKRKTYESEEIAAIIAEQPSEKPRKKSKKKKKDAKVKKIKTKNRDPVQEDLEKGVMETDHHEAVCDVQEDEHEQKPESIPDHRSERVKDENSAEKSDYRITDMELTTAASGHISVIEGADPPEISNEKNIDEVTERSQVVKPNSIEDASQKTEKSVAPCKLKPKSRLPVLKVKPKTSTLKKNVHKSQSRKGTNKDSVRWRDEKDVQQMTVFDLSMGDSFSHPTPSRLITKPQAATESHPDEPVEKDSKVCPLTTGRGSGDGLERLARSEPSDDIEAEGAFANQELDTLCKDRETVKEEKHSKIKRKSRKSKSVVTPGAAEPKKLSEKALLEELSNLDASYLSDVTNPERKSKIGTSLPSRKSSLKDGGESLNDLMVRPHHRKNSKRKLSKRNFYFGESDSEDDQRQSRAERKSVARTSELNTSALSTNTRYPDKPNSDSTFSLTKTSSSGLNTTIDILEDLENVLLEVDEPRDSKKINRRTTILKKPSEQTSRGVPNLNVTFVKDDMCDFEAVKKNKVSKTIRNPEIGISKMNRAKDMKQTKRETFVIEDIAKTFFGNFDVSEIQGEDEVGENVISDISETHNSKQSTTKSAGNHKSTIGCRTGDEDVLEALGRSSMVTQDVKQDEQGANKNKEAELQKKKKVKTRESDALDVSADSVEKQTSQPLTKEPVQPFRKDDLSRSLNDDEVEASSKTQNSQPDESETHKREVERQEAKVQKTNKRKVEDADDDILDGKPSKVAKADVESVPDVPERRGRRSKAVSYKEPKLNSKLRQGDPNTFSVYKPGKTSKQDQVRSPLSNITN